MAVSRSLKGPDWHVCLEPNEMRDSVRIVREVDKSLAAVNKTMAPGENMDRSIMRRSIVANVKIGKNQIIKPDDIAYKRPGTGISPSEADNIIGKMALRTIDSDQLITYSDIK